MKPGVLFFIISDIKDYLVTHGKLLPDGTVLLNDASIDVGLANVINTTLLQHGIDLPDQVDKILAALPLLIGIFIH